RHPPRRPSFAERVVVDRVSIADERIMVTGQEGALLTGGEAVVRALEEQGVRHVFGIPGDHTVPIYGALGASSIRHVTVRHEQGAGFIADGYARSSGQPAVAVTIGGPGLTNIATALGEAYADGVPVLVVSADTPTSDLGAGRDYNHEMKDQRAALSAICAWSERVETHAQIPAAIDRAFAGFATGRQRAIHIGIPIDILDTPGSVTSMTPAPRTLVSPDTADVCRAAALLRSAQRPVVLLGGGARGARDAAARLASVLAAPVMTTWSGIDAFPNDHPLWVGAGFHLQAAIDALTSADVVLAVGTQLGRSDFWNGAVELTSTVIRIDLDPTQLNRNATATVGLLGDARLTLDALADEYRAPGTTDGSSRAAKMRHAIDTEADLTGIRYRPWLAAMRRGLPANAAIVADSTLVTYRGFRYLPVPAEGRWLYPNAYGTLGYALPAAIGVGIAEPGRPAGVLIGDGGLLFTCPELLTASEQGLGIPVVVWNDRGYGCIREGMRERGVTPLGVDFVIPNLSALATAFGADYAAPRTPQALEATVREAVAKTTPTLIEIDDRDAR
ncbi:MAG: acetolactate synthase large subunit, partial [Thermomicrobiales bacterium]|nr:acetolactate synthase large subunit [Thermomicrobiales bacterium]